MSENQRPAVSKFQDGVQVTALVGLVPAVVSELAEQFGVPLGLATQQLVSAIVALLIAHGIRVYRDSGYVPPKRSDIGLKVLAMAALVPLGLLVGGCQSGDLTPEQRAKRWEYAQIGWAAGEMAAEVALRERELPERALAAITAARACGREVIDEFRRKAQEGALEPDADLRAEIIDGARASLRRCTVDLVELVG